MTVGWGPAAAVGAVAAVPSGNSLGLRLLGGDVRDGGLGRGSRSQPLLQGLCLLEGDVRDGSNGQQVLHAFDDAGAGLTARRCRQSRPPQPPPGGPRRCLQPRPPPPPPGYRRQVPLLSLHVRVPQLVPPWLTPNGPLPHVPAAERDAVHDPDGGGGGVSGLSGLSGIVHFKNKNLLTRERIIWNIAQI